MSQFYHSERLKKVFMGFKVLNYELSKLDQPPHRKLEGKT